MKNTIKNVFIRVLTVLMLVTVFTVPSVKQADAAAAGSSMSNPVVMVSGTTYKKKWTKSGQELYTKITVPARGVVTFTMNKPLDYYDEYSYYDISILNSSGTELTRIGTYGTKSQSAKNVAYKIGLAKGTYYFKIKSLAYYSSSGRTSFTANYNYKYTKTSAWEVEPNNTKKKATALTLGSTFKGEFAEEDYSFGAGSHDYFKVSLTKGVSYRVSVSGYKALAATTWIGHVTDASDNVIVYMSNKSTSLVKDSFRYWDFTAPSTGTFYIHFYNESEEKAIEYKVNVSKSPANTWKKLNGNWYYFNGSNKLAVGWQKVGTKWYYFDSSGVMQKSRWIYNGDKKCFVGADGAMLTGWQKIMVSSDSWSWYYLGSDGYARTGWLKLGGKWYYLTSSGQMVYGGYWYVNGVKYIFDDNGVCQNP